MNIIYFNFLKIIRPIFERLNVNFDQMVAIVGVKLKMDNRRVRFNQYQQNKKETNNSLWLTLFINAMFATFIGALLTGSNSIISSYSMAFAFVMFMLGFTLISDFSSVILDSNDNAVLLPRPIDNTTMFVARIVHIMTYLISIMLSLALPIAIWTAYRHGFSPAITFLGINFLSLLLVVFLTNIFYLVLMKFTSEEKLRNYINYSQIIFTFIMMGGYRLVGNLINLESLESGLEIGLKLWHYFIPPIWMGNIMEIAVKHHFESHQSVFILLTVLIPIVAFFFLKNKAFSSVFNEKLAGIDVANRANEAESSANSVPISAQLSKIFTSTPVEKGAFEFVWKVTTRDRKFKLRVYPSLAYMLIYPVFMFGNGQQNQTFMDQINAMKDSPSKAIMMIYFSLMAINIIITQIEQSDEFKASWIFQMAPINKPGEVLSGAFRSIIVKFITPILLILSIILPLLWGINILIDLLFGIITILNLNLIINLGLTNYFPFSQEINNKSKNSMIKVFGYFIVAGIVGFGHYFLMKVPYVITGFTVLQFFMLLFFLKKYKELGWEKVKI
jgi:ABC-2 type transport system permease protein